MHSIPNSERNTGLALYMRALETKGVRSPARRRLVIAVAALAAGTMAAAPSTASASCASPANPVEAENCLPGTPQATWDVPGTATYSSPGAGPSGDPTIQGFSTDISVDVGGTVFFKIKTTAAAYRLEIYRLGYYQGNGARLVTTILPSARLPQTQPACLSDAASGLIDCGNWAVSASWPVPMTAVSGIYVARLVRTDTGGASHVVFVVRDDSRASDILFQTSDTTWQAYNESSGNGVGKSLYGCGNWNESCRAFKVSYNRPFDTRQSHRVTYLFESEYPMVRWLEANGYDVTYSTGVDTDRYPLLVQNHKAWLSNGHDEYWSSGQWNSVQGARDAGVNLGFFSGNTTFWKVRWESSIDGSGTPYRTLVCYKETLANAKTDPADPPTWTGTWRDPRFSPPADGGRPENSLKGSIFRINGLVNWTLTVPQDDGRMRLWRNTNIAALLPGQTATLAPGSLGFEVDVDEDNGSRPPGLFHLSSTPISTTTQYLLDYGGTYGAGATTHNLTMYRHNSGALVFSTGTWNWSWGLDSRHDDTAYGATTDARMQQATVNLLADMGVQPSGLQASLVRATKSTDASAPVSAITSPYPGATLTAGSDVSITGTASDLGGGVIGGVEVSTDGGANWHPAAGRENWNYTWTPSVSGPVSISSRAVDDSGNIEIPSAGVSVQVTPSPNATIWPATAVPVRVDGGGDSAVELGVRFRSDSPGYVKGVRFYKASTNTGAHVANLWTGAGTLVATAMFTGETASGWQQVLFPTPVAVTANTVYVASYHATGGHYSADQGFFSSTGVDTPPLHALANTVPGGNGVYAYGATSNFPNQTWNASNYWVDVVFSATPPPTLKSVAVTPASAAIQSGATQQFTATGSYSDGTTQNVTSTATWTSSSVAVATVSATGLATGVAPGPATISAMVGTVGGTSSLTVQAAPLAITTASLAGGTLNLPYTATLAATGGTKPYTWSIASGLPVGLTLNAAAGTISGTPTVVGSFTFTAQVTDAVQGTTSTSLSILVTAAPPPTIGTTTLPNATQGKTYSSSLAASGGIPPYTWSFTGGLPPGVVLGSTTGALSGTPSAAGSFSFIARVTDAIGGTAVASLAITVLVQGTSHCGPAPRYRRMSTLDRTARWSSG
jgi:hypothetical protein